MKVPTIFKKIICMMLIVILFGSCVSVHASNIALVTNTNNEEVDNLYQTISAVERDVLYSIMSKFGISTKQMTTTSVSNASEMRAVWISFLEFSNAKVAKMSETQFKAYIDKMFTKCVDLHMNTVIVQIRPYADAMYPSSYFPWSKFASGKQGKSPGYDPLKCMVSIAHKKKLKIHAWLNPYRVAMNTTNVKTLSKNNQARKWRGSSQKSKQRNVLSFAGNLYYNPAKSEVQKLIVNGVKEIVQKYDVDGIHFDDYFYPTLGNNYKKNFDYKEYKAYQKKCKKQKVSPKSIINWRRNNINTLVKNVHKAIKQIDSSVEFGISPAGNISNLYGKDRYYVDVKRWMKSSKYVDYICPQIYWSFTNKICPYEKTVKQWASINKNSSVKLYIGLAAYRAGISKKEAKAIGDIGWSKSKQELKKQVVAARKIKQVDGFVFYRYDNMVSSKLKKEVQQLKKVLK